MRNLLGSDSPPIPNSLCTPWKTGINNLIIGWVADFGTCPPPALPVGTIDYQGAKGGRWGVFSGSGRTVLRGSH